MQYYTLAEIAQKTGLNVEQCRGKIRRYLAKRPQEKKHIKKEQQENGGFMSYYSPVLCQAIFENFKAYSNPEPEPENSRHHNRPPEPETGTATGEILFLRALAEKQAETIDHQSKVIGFLSGQITELKKLAAPEPAAPANKTADFWALFIFALFLLIILFLIMNL